MEEINLKRVAKLAWAKKIYIVLIMIISMVAGYFYSYKYVVPEYQSKTTLLLAKISDELNENTVKQSDIADFSMTSTLLQPYISLIESNKVLKEVINNLSLDMTEEELGKMLTVAEENSAMLSITISNEDAELAEKIATEVTNVFVEQAKEIFNIANVNIIDTAEVASEPYNINHLKDLVLFAMFGVFLSSVLVFIFYISDTTVKEEEDIENEIGLPVLGSIPVFDKKLENKSESKNKKESGKKEMTELVILDNAKSPVAESFRALRTNVTFNANTKIILVTSSRMSEGKSFVTANLAVTIAKTDKKVIIIDADMRKGRQNKIFGVDNKKGLSNYLANCDDVKVDIDELSTYIKTTKVPNVHLITLGNRPSNPAELLNPLKIKGLFNVLSEVYDFVIIDGTPSSIIADSVVISKFVDYTMLVTAQKTTKLEDIRRLVKNFEQVGVKISGAVLNKYKLTKEGYNSSYYYSDSNTEEKNEEKNERTEIRTVEDFLREANINIHSFRYLDSMNNNNLQGNTNSTINPAFSGFSTSLKSNSINKNVIDIQSGSSNSSMLEYKMEKIDSEIAILKNMVMQVALNTNQINSKDIELIRNDIRNLKDNINDMRHNESIKKLQEEVETIREFTEDLVASQQDNNEKIKKFIDNYYKDLEDKTKTKRKKTKEE
ncbi:MAG: polysaccharide biosynthesis tyrosine autokinase [Clostridia bacterium]|nr:polysaccharide biosynthesis tyrosine autokinase [Clostridia bacterium]